MTIGLAQPACQAFAKRPRTSCAFPARCAAATVETTTTRVLPSGTVSQWLQSMHRLVWRHTPSAVNNVSAVQRVLPTKNQKTSQRTQDIRRPVSPTATATPSWSASPTTTQAVATVRRTGCAENLPQTTTSSSRSDKKFERIVESYRDALLSHTHAWPYCLRRWSARSKPSDTRSHEKPRLECSETKLKRSPFFADDDSPRVLTR